MNRRENSSDPKSFGSRGFFSTDVTRLQRETFLSTQHLRRQSLVANSGEAITAPVTLSLPGLSEYRGFLFHMPFPVLQALI